MGHPVFGCGKPTQLNYLMNTTVGSESLAMERQTAGQFRPSLVMVHMVAGLARLRLLRAYCKVLDDAVPLMDHSYMVCVKAILTARPLSRTGDSSEW